MLDYLVSVMCAACPGASLLPGPCLILVPTVFLFAPHLCRPPVVVPSPPIIVPGPSIYSSPGVVVAPGAAVVSRGPDIIDIAVVTLFLVMAASAATTMLRSDGDGGFNLTGEAPAWQPAVDTGCVCNKQRDVGEREQGKERQGRAQGNAEWGGRGRDR